MKYSMLNPDLALTMIKALKIIGIEDFVLMLMILTEKAIEADTEKKFPKFDFASDLVLSLKTLTKKHGLEYREFPWTEA